MTNPFAQRSLPPNGSATDIVPVTPSNTSDLPEITAALDAGQGRALVLTTVVVSDHSYLPVGVRPGAATSIHSLVLA